MVGGRQAGGALLLRIDDLDTPRNRTGAIEAIQSDLRWLGLKWDGWWCPERKAWHLPPWSWLRRSGSFLPVAALQAACRSADLPVSPDGWAHWGWQQQRLPSWRLRVMTIPTAVAMLVRRADGFIAYQLATVIDELSFGITDAVRGADLREALPAQRSVCGPW